jgi:DNA-binding IclR family transcriptional regulator
VIPLSNVYLGTLELRTKVARWAQDPASRTGMAMRTGVLLRDDIVIIHHEPRRDGSRQLTDVGQVSPPT